MTRLLDVLVNAWAVSAYVALVAAVVYICWWAFARRGRRAMARSVRARLRFEAIWGIILALPLGLGLLVEATSLKEQPLGAAALVMVAVAFFAIPVAAMQGRRLPAWVRWAPAGVAFSVGTPLALLSVYVLFVPVPWYVAGCMVAVRFARAARAADPTKPAVVARVRERHTKAAVGHWQRWSASASGAGR